MEEKTLHQKVQVCLIALKNSSHPEPQVLFLKRTDALGGKWQNITGSVEEGETVEGAALRETEEETGLGPAEVPSLQGPLKKWRFRDRFSRDVQEFGFFICIEKALSITLDSREHQAYEWRPLLEVQKWDYEYPSHFELLSLTKERIPQ